MKWNTCGDTLIFELFYPNRIHRSCMWSAFTPSDNPIDIKLGLRPFGFLLSLRKLGSHKLISMGLSKGSQDINLTLAAKLKRMGILLFAHSWDSTVVPNQMFSGHSAVQGTNRSINSGFLSVKANRATECSQSLPKGECEAPPIPDDFQKRQPWMHRILAFSFLLFLLRGSM